MLPTLDQMSKGEIGNVNAIIKSICRPNRCLDSTLNPDDLRMVLLTRKMDFDHTPSMREMCIKYGANFIAVLENNKRMKRLHAEQKKGFWLGKNIANMRYTAEIPVEISGNRRNPLFWQYFHPDCTDKYEKRKHLYAFLRKYDMAFSPIEKL